MSNVLAIMGSPRKHGNTDLLFNEFVKGVEEAGSSVDKILLCDKKISPCLEIYGCMKDGHCVIKDDFNELYGKLEMCDKLIIAMPIFFCAMPSHLKALIDRCQAFFVRKYYLKNPVLPKGASKRPMYLIAIGGSKDEKLFDATFLIFKYFLDCLDMELKASLLYRSIDKKGDILKHPVAMQEAYELGLKVGG